MKKEEFAMRNVLCYKEDVQRLGTICRMKKVTMAKEMHTIFAEALRKYLRENQHVLDALNEAEKGGKH